MNGEGIAYAIETGEIAAELIHEALVNHRPALAMAYPRSRLVVASRIGGLTGPIDNPTISSQHAVIREQCADAVSMGMTGKLCLDLEQPAVINESFSPSPSDVTWAYEFLHKFEEGGRVIRDGSDKPRLARAETIKRRAELFKIKPDTEAYDAPTSGPSVY